MKHLKKAKGPIGRNDEDNCPNIVRDKKKFWTEVWPSILFLTRITVTQTTRIISKGYNKKKKN